MSVFQWISKEAISKGWSADRKFCVTDAQGVRYLLRISDMSRYDKKHWEFQMMQQVESLGILMCHPIAFGVCTEGVYSIQSWIDGVDAEEALPACSASLQYVYGRKAGEMLQKIHSIPAPAKQEAWETRFGRKMDAKLQAYRNCPIQYEEGPVLAAYMNEHRALLKGRPQVYQHGDYHIGNMMLDHSNRLHIIDFDRGDYGDPWEEFNRIVWCAQKVPAFASGMVDGYFEDRVPMEFWQLLALYIVSNTLSSICWAIPFGPDEVHTMKQQAKDVLTWYRNMQTVVPSWYQRGL